MAYGQQYKPYPMIQQPYQQQWRMPTYQPAPADVLSGRMVSSREEALAVPVDYQSGVSILPDISHGRIFAKVANSNGSADFMEFRLAPKEEAQAPAFAPMSELDELRKQVAEMREQIDALKKPRRRASDESD